MNKILIFTIFISTICFSQEKFNGLTFTISDDMSKLTYEEKRIKFSASGQIPDLVFSNKINNANIAFKKTFIPLQKNKLEDIKKTLVRQFTSINLKILENKIININGKNFTYVKVIMPTIEGNVISINLTTDIKEKMTMITISYLESLVVWEQNAQKFIESIKYVN